MINLRTRKVLRDIWGNKTRALLVVVSIALGLLARTVPQMQIFIVAMPLKIILGLLFLGFSLPFLASFLRSAFQNLGESIQGVMHLLS